MRLIPTKISGSKVAVEGKVIVSYQNPNIGKLEYANATLVEAEGDFVAIHLKDKEAVLINRDIINSLYVEYTKTEQLGY